MSRNFDSASPIRSHNEVPQGARIKVVSVGAGGDHAINRMIAEGLTGIEFISVHTSTQAIKASHAHVKIQLGAHLTRGIGAGGDPSLGRRAALEDSALLIEALEGADLVFIVAGLGKGTGTGVAPVIASLASQMGALTVAAVTLPFGFEGRRRMRQAQLGLQELLDSADTLIVIPNERLLSAAKARLFFESFHVADDALRQAVQSISEIITAPGATSRNVADVRTTLAGLGYAVMGTATRSGANRAVDATVAAIASPLLDSGAVNNARGILINITGSSSLKLSEVNEASRILRSIARPDADTIFGAVLDESLGDEVRVTLIASDFQADRSRQTEQPMREPAVKEAAPATPTPPIKSAIATSRVSLNKVDLAQNHDSVQESVLLESLRSAAYKARVRPQPRTAALTVTPAATLKTLQPEPPAITNSEPSPAQESLGSAASIADHPKTDEPPPIIMAEVSSVDVPTLLEPAFKQPTLKKPMVLEPTLQEPTLQESMLQESMLQESMLQESMLQESMLQESMLQEPTVQTPALQKLAPQEPTLQEPTLHEPTLQELPAHKPVLQEPTLQEPTLPEPTFKEPTLQEPTLQEPTLQEPTLQEPTFLESTVQKPALQKPTSQEPTLLEPASQEPALQKPTLHKPKLQESTLQEPIFNEPVFPEPTLQQPPFQRQVAPISLLDESTTTPVANLRRTALAAYAAISMPEDFATEEIPTEEPTGFAAILERRREWADDLETHAFVSHIPSEAAAEDTPLSEPFDQDVEAWIEDNPTFDLAEEPSPHRGNRESILASLQSALREASPATELSSSPVFRTSIPHASNERAGIAGLSLEPSSEPPTRSWSPEPLTFDFTDAPDEIAYEGLGWETTQKNVQSHPNFPSFASAHRPEGSEEEFDDLDIPAFLRAGLVEPANAARIIGVRVLPFSSAR